MAAGAAALAWVALYWFHMSPANSHVHAHGAAFFTTIVNQAVESRFRRSLTFLSGWMLMIVAMMLPTILPLVENFRRATRGRADQARLLLLLLSGYLSVWSAFGLLLLFLANAAGRLGASPAGPVGRILAAAVLFIAGIFQFFPVKYRCLEKCRLPLSCVNWEDGHPRRTSLGLGLHYGACCVGCCWALMLVMFVAGSAQLAWMLILTVVMGVEKNLPWGRRLAKPIGTLLLGAAIFRL